MHRLKTHWDKLVLASLLGVCIILLLNLALKLSHEQKLILEVLDILFLLIIAIDVYRRFKVAQDKLQFLKTNWIEIMVLVPIGALSEFLRLGEFIKFGEILEFTRVFKFAQLSVHARDLAASAIPAFAFAGFVHAGKKKRKIKRRSKNKKRSARRETRQP